MGYGTGYKTRFEKRDRMLSAFVIGGGVLLLNWRFYSGALTPDLVLKAYALTVPLFGWLLAADYPPLASRWFWKAMVPVFLIHSVVLYGTVDATVYFANTGVKLPVRMVWSFIPVAVAFEYFLSLRLIRAFTPEGRQEKTQ